MPPSQREMSPQAAAVRILTRSGTLEIWTNGGPMREHAGCRRQSLRRRRDIARAPR
jgi:hypothetical protein